MNPPGKKKAAFFDFACCEGCQLMVLQLEEKLLDMLELVDVVQWREAMSGGADDYDIAFCEGSITREEDVERIKKIRERAEIVVSLGTCASIVCHNALKNAWSPSELIEEVYGPDGPAYDTIPARPITAVVDVDYRIHGCPVSLPEFITVFKFIVTGREYRPPNQPVCVECKLHDNLCVYEKGRVCLGPVTRCGCEAVCTRYGDVCHGCRGLMDEANISATASVLNREELHPIMEAVARKNPLSRREVIGRYNVYDDARERIEERERNESE
jgi:coenzyme F420-reducing hydrogenase gamma subunit